MLGLNIVGVSSHFHDSACCVLRDGNLIAAAQEERFTRLKHDPGIPKEAFRYCLTEAGLTIADVDCVAYYEDPQKKLDRQLWMGLPQLPVATPQALFRLDAMRPEREIRELLGFEGQIEFVEHHQAHAASAFFFSGFDDAAVLTVDAVGEWATTTYGRARGAGLELFEEVQFPHSLGLLYSAITSYLGFDVNDAEYKVMGLAPYGEPAYLDEIRALIEPLEGGQFRLNLEYFDFFRGERMFSDALSDLLGAPPREAESELSPFAKDVARSLQVVLEEILLEKVRYLHGCVPSTNLCLAGGVALNCVAIERIGLEGPFERVFVQPAATDAGGALGAAALAHVRLTGEAPNPAPLAHVYLGPSFSSAHITQLLRPSAAKVEDFAGREDELVEAIAERLASGEVIGWFQGRMEFGPRALGNRSILADPRNPEMRDRINALVKKREAFRPFAPAVLESKARDHFALDHPAPFMVETCQVVSALDLPAITHVDGSARPQTVDGTNPRFHRLLEAFERRTGCPVLLNTSFNMRGEPIVCSPVDALLCFIRSNLDCLVLEDFVLDRNGLPEAWLDWFGGTSPRLERGVADSIYTLL
ncbi:MAG: carbamoyltransferase N-terminal domain-containing protein [Actinomycetota bacterium]